MPREEVLRCLRASQDVNRAKVLADENILYIGSHQGLKKLDDLLLLVRRAGHKHAGVGAPGSS